MNPLFHRIFYCATEKLDGANSHPDRVTNSKGIVTPKSGASVVTVMDGPLLASDSFGLAQADSVRSGPDLQEF